MSSMEPIVVKSLKMADIQKRMTLPTKFLKCFPSLNGDKHMVDFRVRDECGHVWKFRIYTRKQNKKYPKPVLTKGWREFVCSKQLCIGDKVAFYMDKEEGDGDKYHVRVEKAVKIFGGGFGSRPSRAALVGMDSEAKSSANEAVRRMEMKMEAMEEKYSLMENHIARMTSYMEKFLGSSYILSSEQTMIREQEAKKQNALQCSDESEDTLCQVMGEEKGDCVETFEMCPDSTGVFGSRPDRAALVMMDSEAQSSANEEVSKMAVKMEAMEENISLMENHIAKMTSDVENFLQKNGGSSNFMSRVLGGLKIMFWFGWQYSV